MDGNRLVDKAYDSKLTVDELKQYIAAGKDVNYHGMLRYTALICTARNGQTELTQMLLDANADVNMQSNNGYTALHNAARNNHPAVIAELIKAGADVSLRDNDNDTALEWATRFKNQEAIEALTSAARQKISTNEDAKRPIASSIDGKTLIEKAWYNKLTVDELKQYIAAGKDVNYQHEYGYTALMYTARNGQTELTQMLLDANADVNMQDNTKWTALHLAARHNHLAVIAQLIKAGANVSLRNNKNETALELAKQLKNQEAIEALKLAMKGQVVSVDEDTKDPLGNVDTVSEVVEKTVPHSSQLVPVHLTPDEALRVQAIVHDDMYDALTMLSVSSRLVHLCELGDALEGLSQFEREKRLLLNSHVGIYEFYRVVHTQMHCLFLAGSVAKSGHINSDNTTMVSYVGMGLGFLGDFLKTVVPATWIGSAVSGAGEVLKFLDEKKQTAGLALLRNFAANSNEMDYVADVIAYHCTKSLQEKLRDEKTYIADFTTNASLGDQIKVVFARFSQTLNTLTGGFIDQFSVNADVQTMAGVEAMNLMSALVAAFFGKHPKLHNFAQEDLKTRLQMIIAVLPNVPPLTELPAKPIVTVPATMPIEKRTSALVTTTSSQPSAAITSLMNDPNALEALLQREIERDRREAERDKIIAQLQQRTRSRIHDDDDDDDDDGGDVDVGDGQMQMRKKKQLNATTSTNERDEVKFNDPHIHKAIVQIAQSVVIQQAREDAAKAELKLEDEARKPQWMEDNERNDCLRCSEPFSFFRGRHHCRACGALVCGACSKYKGFARKMPGNLPVSVQAEINSKQPFSRVCNHCKKIQDEATIRALGH